MRSTPIASVIWSRSEGAFSHTGVEGLVVKRAGSRYEPGKRSRIKVKTRETIDVICGAITGSLARPEVVVAGRYRGKDLEVVGAPCRSAIAKLRNSPRC